MRSIRGVLASAMLARAIGMRGIVIPQSLRRRALRAPSPGRASPPRGTAVDMSEVRGQNLARAAIEVAAAGGHNVLLAGPPRLGGNDKQVNFKHSSGNDPR